jgi:hypothetical protein
MSSGRYVARGNVEGCTPIPNSVSRRMDSLREDLIRKDQSRLGIVEFEPISVGVLHIYLPDPIRSSTELLRFAFAVVVANVQLSRLVIFIGVQTEKFAYDCLKIIN